MQAKFRMVAQQLLSYLELLPIAMELILWQILFHMAKLRVLIQVS